MKASKWSTNPLTAKAEPIKFQITKAGDDLIQVTLVRPSPRGVSDRLRIVMTASEAQELAESLGIMRTLSVPHV